MVSPAMPETRGILMFLSPSLGLTAKPAPSSEGAGIYTQVENMAPSDEGAVSALR